MAADAAEQGEGQVGVAAVGATPSQPSGEGPVKGQATCSGPTGPCVLEMGHEGDHVRIGGHTPLPWTVDPTFPRDVLDVTGADIATTYTPGGSGNRPLSEATANRDLIVRAVNAHDALLGACRLAHGMLTGVRNEHPQKLSYVLAAAIASAEGR